MQGSVQIEIDVQKVDFSKASQEVGRFARDTGKALDPIRKTKLEMDVANATVQLGNLRAQMKDFQGTMLQKKQLIIDTNNAQSQLTETKRKLQNFNNTGDEGLSRLQSKFNGIGGAVSTAKIAIGSFLGGLATSLFTSAIGAVQGFATSIVSLGAKLEQTKVAFTTMLGSAGEADALLRDLTDFASKTPFEINGIRDTAKQLLAFGFSSKEIIPTLKSLGDVSAGLSVPIEQIAYAYGQVRSANQLYGTELRQFVNAGVPILAELARMFGVTEAEAKKLVEAGKVGFKDVEKAFQNMTSEGGKFENLMDKQSKTVAGAWSNLKDTFTKTAEAMGIQLMPALASVITSVAKMTQNVGDAITGANDFTFGIGKLTDAMNDNKKEQEDLETAFKNGAIGMVEYNRKTQELQAEEEFLKESLTKTKLSSDDLNEALSNLDSLKLSTDQKVAELRKIQIQAQESAYALDKLIQKLEDTRLGLSKMVAKEKKETESGNRSLIGVGGVSTITQSQLNIVDFQLQAKKQEADKINNTIAEIDKKLGGGTKKSGGGGSSGGKSGTSALEKQVKEDMASIDDKIKASEGKWKDYQKEIENTQKKIKDLRDSATSDIEDINRQLKDLEGKGSDELAKRYAEVVKELAGSNVDDAERNKLLEEKLFLEGKVSEELRNQAVEYSKLSEAQKIFKDNEKEIVDLTEKKKIAQAFLAGNLTTTADGGIGMKDENDPTKIVAITGLKNQQYALDLVNKQQAYELDLQAQTQKAEDELKILTDLQEEKLALEQAYTKLFGDEIEKQKVIVDGLIQKMKELIALQQRAGVGGGGGGSSTTNNQTNTINVSNNVDVKAVTNVLTKTTR